LILLLLAAAFDAATTEEELVKAVETAESAVSREHTMWMAKR
jgi:hypothetical protein